LFKLGREKDIDRDIGGSDGILSVKPVGRKANAGVRFFFVGQIGFEDDLAHDPNAGMDSGGTASLDRIWTQSQRNTGFDDVGRLDIGDRFAIQIGCDRFEVVVIGLGHADIDKVNAMGAGPVDKIVEVFDRRRPVFVDEEIDLLARDLELVIRSQGNCRLDEQAQE
jgi:hypothetical protein